MKVAASTGGVSYQASLIVDGLVFFYAMVARDGVDDDKVFRRASRSPLYGRAEELAADLEADGIASEPGIFEVVDLDRALVAAQVLRDSTDFDAVITVWNALSDLLPAAELPFDFTGDVANRVYDKLFCGLNLPSLTSPGTRFVPRWTPKERRKVAQLIRVGVARVRGLVASERASALPRARLWTDFVIEAESPLARTDWAASMGS